MCFHCYDNLTFTLAYNGKWEKWSLLLSHCRYFDKRFTEMFFFFFFFFFFHYCHDNGKAKLLTKAFIAVYSGEQMWPMGLVLEYNYRNVRVKTAWRCFPYMVRTDAKRQKECEYSCYKQYM